MNDRITSFAIKIASSASESIESMSKNIRRSRKIWNFSLLMGLIWLASLTLGTVGRLIKVPGISVTSEILIFFGHAFLPVILMYLLLIQRGLAELRAQKNQTTNGN